MPLKQDPIDCLLSALSGSPDVHRDGNLPARPVRRASYLADTGKITRCFRLVCLFSITVFYCVTYIIDYNKKSQKFSFKFD
jgi:hypothetical protein